MFKTTIAAFIALLALSTTASAQNCLSYPYNFSNGTIADANQVNSNFSSILNCANSSLAPLAGPLFTGNVGIGVTSSSFPLDVGGIIRGTELRAATNQLGTGDARITAVVTNNATDDPFFRLQFASATTWVWGLDASDSGKLKLGRSGGNPTPSTITPYMTVDTSGNIGIGTARFCTHKGIPLLGEQ